MSICLSVCYSYVFDWIPKLGTQFCYQKFSVEALSAKCLEVGGLVWVPTTQTQECV